MKKILWILGFWWGGWLWSYGQVDCGNIGFETGTTQGWTLTNGSIGLAGIQLIYLNEVAGTYDNGHLITKRSDGNDPNVTREALPMVAPGSQYSIRIGNGTANRGSKFDRIKTTFIVSPDNTLFQYQFAVVLNKDRDDTHLSHQKPGFSLLIYDENKTPIACSYYDVQLTRAGVVAGFKVESTTVEYRPWTTGAIDLRNYIGRKLTVEVTAHGCTQRGHYGYAYFDAQCLKAEIKPTSVCPDANGDLTLVAPNGFASYKWNTGQTGTSIKIKPKIGDKYFVKVVAPSSLDESCELQLDYTVKHQKADTTITKTICEGDSYTVGTTVYRTSGKYVTKIDRGESCDSTVTLNLTVKPLTRYAQKVTICEGQSLTVGTFNYTTAGIYTTTISRPSLCDSIVTTTLVVDKIELSIQPTEVVVAEGDSAQLRATLVSAFANANYTYRWEPDRGLSCPTCAVTWAYPEMTTKYKLTVTNADNTCQKVAEARVRVSQCGIYTPDIFSPNDDRQNDVFFVQAGDCVKQIKEMTIYSRWGEVIFHQANVPISQPAYGWDGKYLGQLLGVGTFPYRITIEFTDPEVNPYTYTGVVMLMK